MFGEVSFPPLNPTHLIAPSARKSTLSLLLKSFSEVQTDERIISSGHFFFNVDGWILHTCSNAPCFFHLKQQSLPICTVDLQYSFFSNYNYFFSGTKIMNTHFGKWKNIQKKIKRILSNQR